MLTPTEAEEQRSSARPPLWSSHLAGAPTVVVESSCRDRSYGLGSGEGVPLDLLPALYPLTPHYWCRVAALLSQTSRDHSCGRVTWQVLMRGTPLDHSCGRVAKLALERRRVQQRCPRAPTPEPGKGRRPKNRQSQRRNVFLPWCPVSSLSWPACSGAFLVPGRWFSGPAPSGSCLLWFRLMFFSTGRGRHVPAPSGRDVGSSSGAPTQEPVQGADPRTGFYRYPSTYDFVVYLLALVYLVALALLFPFLFATLFSEGVSITVFIDGCSFARVFSFSRSASW